MSATNAMPNPTTHCLRVKLTGDNLFEFQAELFENCVAYDDVGRELRCGKLLPFSEPARPPETTTTIEDGVEVTTPRVWTIREQEDYKRDLGEYSERKKNYKRHSHLLFLLITNSLSSSVLQRVRLQPEYREHLDKSNVLGLWKLIGTIYMSVSGNSIAQLKNRWQNLHQVNRETGQVTPLRDHLTQVDSHVTLLISYKNQIEAQKHMRASALASVGEEDDMDPITNESIPTERDFLLQLVNSLAPHRYTILTASIITGKDTTTTYEKLKAELLKLEESGQLGPLNSEPSAHTVNFATISPEKKTTRKRKHEGKPNGDRKPKSQKTDQPGADFICYNCGKPGHYPKDCPEPEHTCKKCGRKRHQEKYCKGKSKGKKGNAVVTHSVDLASEVMVVDEPPATTDEIQDTEAEIEPLCLRLYNIKMARSLKLESTGNGSVQVDSGASISVFNSTKYVKAHAETLEEVTGTGVKGISGETLMASHRGRSKVIGQFLIVPKCADNLLSVAELTKQGLYSVLFEDNACFITHRLYDTVPPIKVDKVDKEYVMTAEQFHELMLITHCAYAALAEDEGHRIPHMHEPDFSKEQRDRAREVRALHNMLLHPSDHALSLALKNGLIVGTQLTETDVKNAAKINGPCIHCVAGKVTRPTYSKSMAAPADKVGAIVHCDLYCFKEPIIGNSKYALICLDEFSGYINYYQLQNKSKAVLQTEGFYKLFGKYKSFKHTIHMIESDHEVNIASCEAYIGHLGARLMQMPPYQHAQRIERYVRTIKDRARATTDQLVYELPLYLLGELIRAIIKRLNDLPNSLHPTRSPRVLMEGTKLDIAKTVELPFGQICMFHSAGRQGNKREARSELGIALGPSDLTYGAVRAFLFKEKVVVERSHYTALDRIPVDFPFPLKQHRKQSSMHLADELFLKESPRGLVSQQISMLDEGDVLVSAEDFAPQPPLVLPIPHEEGNKTVTSAQEETEPSVYDQTIVDYMLMRDSDLPATSAEGGNAQPISEEAVESIEVNQPSSSAIGNDLAEPIEPADDFAPTASNAEASHETVDVQPESRYPRRSRGKTYKDGPAKMRETDEKVFKAFRVSVKQALSGPYAQQSREAIMDEIRNMLSYQVGHYVHYDQIPVKYRRNLLSSFMFIKHKKKPDGRYDKTKARIVGNGKRQKEHLYGIISSSTVSLAGVFLLMNYSSYSRANMSSYDIKGAFLNSKFTEEDEPIYLIIPREIADIWIILDPTAAEFLNEKGELLLCLDRFIYGLKQSPYKFQLALQAALKEIGYENCLNDDCLYIKKEGPDVSLLSTHVDDILQVSTKQSLVKELHDHLVKHFTHVTFNQKADSYLGMSIKASADKHTIQLSQHGLVNEIIDKFLKEGYGPVVTPAEADLFEVDKFAEKVRAGDNNFISIVMSLMYLARLTRPDILLPVSYLASRAHCATTDDYRKLGRIIRYLKGTASDTLTIQCDDLQLYCHCDASYGIHADGRSHTGYILSLGSTHSYLHARSNKQKVTAISSTDAEIIAVTDALKQIVWLRNLMLELDLCTLQPTVVYQDNRSSIWMMTEPTRYRRSKHILIKVAYIKEKCTEEAVCFVYLKTEEMTADMLTKPTQGQTYSRHKKNMMK